MDRRKGGIDGSGEPFLLVAAYGPAKIKIKTQRHIELFCKGYSSSLGLQLRRKNSFVKRRKHCEGHLSAKAPTMTLLNFDCSGLAALAK